MRHVWFRVVVLGAALAVGSVASAQRDFSDVVIETVPVRGNVYMLVGAGGNIGVSVGPDGLLIVDDQFAPLAAKVRAALAGLSAGKLEFVLNTHWHGDHTGGNEIFGPGSTIVAQANVRKRLETRQELHGRVYEPQPASALPVITFDDSLSVHWNGEEIRAVHYPHGHTDGDAVVFFTTSNVVHMGDDFWSGRFPFVDLESGGDVEGLAQNVAAVIATLPADVKIIPGHGTLSGLEDLESFHAMLVETVGIVRERIAAGRTLDETKKAGLPEKWDSWGSGYVKTEAWLETVYHSLASH
jgi:glyoxylase-like metal-dependent hydrolase (beta-lactamase superfamily II)